MNCLCEERFPRERPRREDVSDVLGTVPREQERKASAAGKPCPAPLTLAQFCRGAWLIAEVLRQS